MAKLLFQHGRLLVDATNDETDELCVVARRIMAHQQGRQTLREVEAAMKQGPEALAAFGPYVQVMAETLMGLGLTDLQYLDGLLTITAMFGESGLKATTGAIRSVFVQNALSPLTMDEVLEGVRHRLLAGMPDGDAADPVEVQAATTVVLPVAEVLTRILVLNGKLIEQVAQTFGREPDGVSVEVPCYSLPKTDPAVLRAQLANASH